MQTSSITNIIAFAGGIALVFYGVFQVYPPGAYIILGLLILNDLYIDIKKD